MLLECMNGVLLVPGMKQLSYRRACEIKKNRGIQGSCVHNNIRPCESGLPRANVCRRKAFGEEMLHKLAHIMLSGDLTPAS